MFEDSKLPEEEHSASSNTIRVPVFGRLHCVRDTEGRLYLCGVLVYWFYGTFSVIYISLWPAYHDGHIYLVVIYGYYAVSGLTLVSLIRSSLTNPGRVPKYDPDKHAKQGWCKCKKCSRMKPPRSHHCRRCGQCVARMDHHCPWINNCVGEANHWVFMQLLVYSFLMGFYSSIVVMCHFWVWPDCVSCDREVFYIKHGVWAMYLELGCAAAIMWAMYHNLLQQHYVVVLDMTTLESIIYEGEEDDVKPSKMTFEKTYAAYRQLCGRGWPIFWWSPFGRKRPYLPSGGDHVV